MIINKYLEKNYNDIIDLQYIKNIFDYESFRYEENNRVFTISHNIEKYVNIIPEQFIKFINDTNMKIELKEYIKKNNNKIITTYMCTIKEPNNIIEIVKDFIIKLQIIYTSNTNYEIKLSYKKSDNIIFILFKNIIDDFISNKLYNIIKDHFELKLNNFYSYKKSLII